MSGIASGGLEVPINFRHWLHYKPTQEEKEEHFSTVLQVAFELDMVGINPERLAQHTIEQNSNSNGDLQQMLADRDMLKALMKSDGDEDLIARRNSIPHPTDPRDRKDLPPSTH